MKKSLIASSVLSLAFGLFLTSASYATAPKAGDFPDIRSLNGAAINGVFDLDRHTIDFDDYSWYVDQDLAWNATLGGAAPAAAISGTRIVDLASTTAPANGSYTFQVQDVSTQTDSSVSDYVASTGLGLLPALSNDQVLTSSSNPSYTYVLDAPSLTGATVTTLGDSVTSSGAALTWSGVYIKDVYDASGNAAYDPRVTLNSGAGTASTASLTAAINGTGDFTLTALGSGLAEPVLVGFRGEGGGVTDYSGVSALVSTALLVIDRNLTGAVNPSYELDDRFETSALGEVARIGFNQLTPPNPPNRRNGPAVNQWVSNVGTGASISVGNGSTGYISVTVIANATLPASLQASTFPNDHSGQVLNAALGAKKGAFIVRNSPVTVTPGYAYAVEASVATDVALSANLPNIGIAITTTGFSEQAVVNYGVGSAPLLTEGWIKMRAYIEPTAAGIADGGTAQGLEAIFVLDNDSNTAANVYIDNVRIYRTALPDDLAWGSSKIAFAGRPSISVGARAKEYVDPTVLNALAGVQIDGGFDVVAPGALGGAGVFTGANAGGYQINGALPAGGSATVGTSTALGTNIEAGQSQWLTLAFNGTQVAPGAVFVRTRAVTPDNTGTPTWSPGLYVLSVDYHTNGATGPGTTIALLDNGAINYSYVVKGNGTSGAIERVRVVAPLRDVDKLFTYLVSTAGAGVAAAGHFDNTQIDLIADNAEYFDTSLFN